MFMYATEGVFLYCSHVLQLRQKPKFRKLQIFISQTTDSHFCKLQISISFHSISFRFAPFRFANYSKPRETE